jgi:hypothetical protein
MIFGSQSAVTRYMLGYSNLRPVSGGRAAIDSASWTNFPKGNED